VGVHVDFEEATRRAIGFAQAAHATTDRGQQRGVIR